MPKTAMYATRTPKATEASTVKQRIRGMNSEITFQPTLKSEMPRLRIPYTCILQRRIFNLTALTLAASDD
jgi:hypothetical protein